MQYITIFAFLSLVLLCQNASSAPVSANPVQDLTDHLDSPFMTSPLPSFGSENMFPVAQQYIDSRLELTSTQFMKLAELFLSDKDLILSALAKTRHPTSETIDLVSYAVFAYIRKIEDNPSLSIRSKIMQRRQIRLAFRHTVVRFLLDDPTEAQLHFKLAKEFEALKPHDFMDVLRSGSIESLQLPQFAYILNRFPDSGPLLRLSFGLLSDVSSVQALEIVQKTIANHQQRRHAISGVLGMMEEYFDQAVKKMSREHLPL
jgi:hypothetical protein